MTGRAGGREQAAEAVLSVFTAVEMGAGFDVAVDAALRPRVDRVLKKAMAASSLRLDPYRRPGAVGAAMVEGMSEAVGDHLGITVRLLAQLVAETGRPAGDLLTEVLADDEQEH